MRSEGWSRIVVAVFVGVWLLGAPASAQPAASRERWLERLSDVLEGSAPDVAFEEWVADWTRARERSDRPEADGLAGHVPVPGVRAEGSAPAAPPISDELLDELGQEARGRVDAALREAMAAWAAAPTDENLARVEALARVHGRLRGEETGAVAGSEAAAGRPLRDASGELLGWDRDGDRVVDVVDSDGDGAPDRYIGGTNPTAYGDAFGGLRQPSTIVTSVLGRGARRSVAAAAAEPDGRRRTVPTRAGVRSAGSRPADTTASLPSLERFLELAEAARPPARTIEEQLGRAARGARIDDGPLARALEQVGAQLGEAHDLARRAQAEARSADRQVQPDAVRQLGEALLAWGPAEQHLRRARAHAGRGGATSQRRAAAALDRISHTIYEICAGFHATAVELGVLSPDEPRPVPPSSVADDGDGADEPSEPSGGTGVGTGFAVADGRHVVTNAHVVRAARDVVVQAATGTQRAQVVAVDEALDLAVLRVPTAVGQPLAFGPDAREPGGVVFACGYGALTEADDASHLLTTRGSLATTDGRVVLFDAHVNPGNSGGPLLDARGCVIGVVKAKLVGDASRGFDSLGVAVDGEAAARWLAAQGVEVARRPGPARGDRLPFDLVRPAVVRILVQR